MKHATLNVPISATGKLRYSDGLADRLRHPVFAWLGLRRVIAQHTAGEHSAIQRWAAGRSTLVEIGVAEGVSAMALREGMAKSGVLYLIDPFHLSRISALNFMKRAARRAVNSCRNGTVVWIEKFSQDAVCGWNRPIDFLLIDGDHAESAVERDWNNWSRFVKPGGVAIFHDARVFEGGWTSPAYGPVKLVDRLFRQGNSLDWSIAEEIHSLMVVERRK